MDEGKPKVKLSLQIGFDSYGTLDKNPYRPNSDDYYLWIRGFNTAKYGEMMNGKLVV